MFVAHGPRVGRQPPQPLIYSAVACRRDLYAARHHQPANYRLLETWSYSRVTVDLWYIASNIISQINQNGSDIY